MFLSASILLLRASDEISLAIRELLNAPPKPTAKPLGLTVRATLIGIASTSYVLVFLLVIYISPSDLRLLLLILFLINDLSLEFNDGTPIKFSVFTTPTAMEPDAAPPIAAPKAPTPTFAIKV